MLQASRQLQATPTRSRSAAKDHACRAGPGLLGGSARREDRLQQRGVLYLAHWEGTKGFDGLAGIRVLLISSRNSQFPCLLCRHASGMAYNGHCHTVNVCIAKYSCPCWRMSASYLLLLRGCHSLRSFERSIVVAHLAHIVKHSYLAGRESKAFGWEGSFSRLALHYFIAGLRHSCPSIIT